MRRSHRRSAWHVILARFGVRPETAAMNLSLEADRIEAIYGAESVAHVRELVQGADRKARKHLYRLHDELARRRRLADEGDEFAGLMA